MALVLGTNCGFVLSAPVADPGGAAGIYISRSSGGRSLGYKATSPAGATKITELGWYCSNATEAANFDIALYVDNANYPGAVVGSISANNAKGTTEGWKVVTGLNISITEETTYWLGVQCDTTATDTTIDCTSDVGQLYQTKSATTALTDPFVAGASSGTYYLALYAVYEVAEAEAGSQHGRTVAYVY